MNRSIAGALTSRKTKWVALGFWIAVLLVAGPLAGKLTGAQQNDAISWLPGSAESTKVLAEQQAFVSPDALPAVVVYERPGGVTAADRAKAAADARRFATVESVDGNVTGPIPSEDGAALQTIVTLNLGSDG